MKLLKMSAFTHIRDRLDDIRAFSSATMSIIKLIIGAALVINLLAGVWHFLGMRAIETGYYNWLSKYCPDPHISCADGYSLWHRYLLSLYFTITTMTSTGYGDVLPVGRNEYVMAMFLQLTGNVFVAILVGNVLGIVASWNQVSEKQRARSDGVNTLMEAYNLPSQLRRQLRKWARSVEGGVVDSNILVEMPDTLRREFLLISQRPLLDKLKLFKGRVSDPEFQPVIADVLFKLQRLKFEAEDYVTVEGNPVEGLYFITAGTVEVFQGEEVVGQRGTGDMLGEYEVMFSPAHVFSSVAMVPTTAHLLKKQDLVDILRAYPAFAKDMRALAGLCRKEAETVLGRPVETRRLPDSSAG